MASNHFNALTHSILELKRVYLDDALATALPSPEQQELSRAFVVFAHAEFEFFVEESLRDFAALVLSNSAQGKFSKASIALLTFSNVPPMTGGTELGTGNKKGRKVASRVGAAVQVALKSIDENHGVRTNYLAAMLVPFGLDGDAVDNTWLAELDTFCALRGAYAHSSRTTTSMPSPSDVWNKCKRLVWTNPALASQGVIGSFENLDEWFANESTVFGRVILMPGSRWRAAVSKLGQLFGCMI
jgi:hypothetical protein